MSFRATYETIYVGALLGPEPNPLDLEWATEAGDATAAHEFTVSTTDAADAYIGLQAFDVGAYGHEIEINGESLTGFDVPPNEGWQYWMDTITGTSLVEGTNTIRVVRDTDSDDAFAVGTVAVHWKEPVE